MQARAQFHGESRRLRPLLALAVTFMAATLLTACSGGSSGGSSGDTQVAAKVGKGEISVRQVEVALKRQPALAALQPQAAAKIVLDSLVEQEVAAQAAVQQGLDRDPSVIQALALARREVLARAFQDGVAAQTIAPTDDDIGKFYVSQPALFAQRRIYTLQETAVDAPATAVAQLQQLAAASQNADELAEALRQEKLAFRSRLVPKAPEDLEFAIVDAMAALKDGQTLVVPQAAGVTLYTVMHSELAPIDRASATPIIASYLFGQRRRDILADRMKALRGAAAVELQGVFAQPNAAGASAVSPAQ